MSFTKAAIFRNIGVGILCLLGIAACEQDLEDIAVDLAGQRPFGTGDTLIEVISYTINVDSSRVDNNNINKIPLPLWGVNRDLDFGELQSKTVTQVNLPLTGVDFGDNAIVDEVVLNIPYFYTFNGTQDAIDPETGDPIVEDGDTIQVPDFILDSIYGNKEVEFQARVFELETFLNTLDPNDPTKRNSYYSNRDFELSDMLHDDLFIPNKNDTVLYVERRHYDDDPSTVDDIDTIKAEDVFPTMKFRLDKQFFQDRFIDHDNPSDFANNDNFHLYFKGLYLEGLGVDGSLINMSLGFATMTIYYTNDETDDDGEVVREGQSMIFPIGGVNAASYQRDYGGTSLMTKLLNPDKINGEPQLYVQGASGSEAIIELFTEEQLEEMRAKQWLINEANLVFYIDGEQDEVPEQLFLYKKDFNSLILDYYTQQFGPDFFGGQLEYDDDGNPDRYRFRITNYLLNVLKEDDNIALSKLALKNFVNTDNPDFLNLDTIVQDWNYIPKGVVLHGNRSSDIEKRVYLEIFYSNNP